MFVLLVLLLSFTTTASAQNALTDIKAVVADYDGSQDVSWIRETMEVDIVGKHSSQAIRESRPWLQWIVDNYDKLPARVFFSHGHRHAWHCDHHIQDIAALHAPVTFLSRCTWKGDDLFKTALRQGEVALLDGLHLALYNSTWKDWLEHNDFSVRHCCAESVVTAASIRRLDRNEYRELIATIDALPCVRWAWVFERTWQSLFTTGTAFGPQKTVKALQKFQKELGRAQCPRSSFLSVARTDINERTSKCRAKGY